MKNLQSLLYTMSENKVLTEEEIDDALEDMKIWGLQFEKLATKVEFNSYKEAVFFANTVFSLAEEEFHHPKITIEYGSVKIDLWTHDVDGVTEKDLELAEKIEEKVENIDWS